MRLSFPFVRRPSTNGASRRTYGDSFISHVRLLAGMMTCISFKRDRDTWLNTIWKQQGINALIVQCMYLHIYHMQALQWIEEWTNKPDSNVPDCTNSVPYHTSTSDSCGFAQVGSAQVTIWRGVAPRDCGAATGACAHATVIFLSIYHPFALPDVSTNYTRDHCDCAVQKNSISNTMATLEWVSKPTTAGMSISHVHMSPYLYVWVIVFGVGCTGVYIHYVKLHAVSYLRYVYWAVEISTPNPRTNHQRYVHSVFSFAFCCDLNNIVVIFRLLLASVCSTTTFGFE